VPTYCAAVRLELRIVSNPCVTFEAFTFPTENIHYFTLFLIFELGARTEQKDGRTDGRTDRTHIAAY